MFFQLDRIGNGILRSLRKAFFFNKAVQFLFGQMRQKYLAYSRAMGRISKADPGGHPQTAGIMIELHLIDIDDLTPVKKDHVDRLLCSFCKVSEERFCLFPEIELTKEKVAQFH
jgi:hypothetical protein